MKITLIVALTFIFLFVVSILPSHTEARARHGSIRIGGYTSHGKGSHYTGGYIKSILAKTKFK